MDMEINQSLEQSATHNLPMDLQEIIEPEQIVTRSRLEIIQQIDKQPLNRIQSGSSEGQSSLNIIQEINEQTIEGYPRHQFTNSCSNFTSDRTEDEEWEESGSTLVMDEQNDSDLENICRETEQDFAFKVGDFVLVYFPEKKKSHLYVCIIQQNLNYIENEVIALNYCNETKTIFRLNERDVSVINTSQIIEKLESPKIVSLGDRIRYEFSSSLNVDG
ncbi:hypothetical protein JTB14_027700 [Gonioctena quinquepunctata]|nr:hypothetical protein JTB14_027700 [Gonioctena quinquepunctata]